MNSFPYNLEDLIDARALQSMLESLYQTAKIPSAIIDMNGHVLAGTGWQQICFEFHRTHPEAEKLCVASDVHIRNEVIAGNPFVIYECPHGLVDSCCPVIIEGHHLANVFTGQLVHRPPDEAMIERFKKQAAIYGFDEALYLDALFKVPVFSPAEHEAMLMFLSQFAKFLAEAGLTNLRSRRNAKELEESEAVTKRALQKYEAVLGTVMDGFWSAAEDGRLLEVNEAYCLLSGYSEAELLGMRIRDLDALESAEENARHIATVISEGRDRFETRHRRKDGTLIDVEISAHFTRKAGGQFFVFVRDITAQKLAEEERSKLEARLRQTQKMEAVGTLAGGIAHDFNNISGAILGYSDLALDYLDENHPARFNLTQVITAGERARDLVRRILTFSRKTEQSVQSVYLDRMLEEALVLLRATIPSTVEIRKEIEVSNARIEADPAEISQVVLNLCSNAAQAMEKQGGVLTVRLREVRVNDAAVDIASTRGAERFYEITVEDTGEGIDPGVVDRIFDPFFTTKPVNRGTGMGLSVVHGIVDNLGGRITVESRMGEGSLFKVILPAGAEVDVQQAKPMPPSSEGRERVLLVDDEELLLKVTKSQLEKLGYQVSAFLDANEAAARFAAAPDAFDIVVTDHIMPKMTGEQLALEVYRSRPNIPVLLCTGYMPGVDKQTAKSFGIRGFIEKPVKKQVLAAAIREALSKGDVPDMEEETSLFDN